ncbi:Ig-like domain-containing protein, partial [Conexibacter stalactiti]
MPTVARLSLALATLLSLLLLLLTSATAQADPTCLAGAQVTFTYTGAEQCYTVPSGPGTLRVEAIGARGGANGRPTSAAGGSGARIAGDIAATPGSTLYVLVGGNGAVGTGGFNGGGAAGTSSWQVCDGWGCSTYPTAGGGGGGATDIRTLPSSNPLSLDARLLVAAGGGGGGGAFFGGGNGGAAGQAGSRVTFSLNEGVGGAGTASAPGAGGAIGGLSGSGAIGGAGSQYGGAGGGGGLYGGGGSGNDGSSYEYSGGGGGGSSLVPAGGTLGLSSAPAAVTFTFYGDPVTLALRLAQSTLVADGGSTTTATATVRDGDGFPVPGRTVTFTSSGSQQIGATTDYGDGTYSATVTATTTAGTATIRASVGALSDSATLTQSAGPATQISLSFPDAVLYADGSSFADANITVRDANGNPVAGQTVTLASDGGQTVGGVGDLGNGSYYASVTASTTPGRSTLTATLPNASGQPRATATLTQLRACVTGSLRRFETTGDEQCWTVPAGVSSVRVLAVGGAGGSGGGAGVGGGGRGATAVRDLTVTPGQRLFVHVAGNAAGKSGGFNGGGDGGDRQPMDIAVSLGNGGGGASDVRTCRLIDCPLGIVDSRQLIAAGGGGGASEANGGAAGGNGGQWSGTGGGKGGGAGTASAGGAGGAAG